jgi:hypothetical protein
MKGRKMQHEVSNDTCCKLMQKQQQQRHQKRTGPYSSRCGKLSLSIRLVKTETMSSWATRSSSLCRGRTDAKMENGWLERTPKTKLNWNPPTRGAAERFTILLPAGSVFLHPRHIRIGRVGQGTVDHRSSRRRHRQHPRRRRCRLASVVVVVHFHPHNVVRANRRRHDTSQ